MVSKRVSKRVSNRDENGDKRLSETVPAYEIYYRGRVFCAVCRQEKRTGFGTGEQWRVCCGRSMEKGCAP
jgi:hypothetical protein